MPSAFDANTMIVTRGNMIKSMLDGSMEIVESVDKSGGSVKCESGRTISFEQLKSSWIKM